MYSNQTCIKSVLKHFAIICFDLVKFYQNFLLFLGGNFFPPGRNLAPSVSFVALFFWRMSFETCPKRTCLAVLGYLLLNLSYICWG